MRALIERIKREGKCFEGGILKVDKFINHQMDPNLMKQISVREYHVVISKEYLTKDDKVLFVDDFLAYGNAAKGIIDLCRQAGCELVGMGFIIEKAFQHGREAIEREGVRCESLAIIDSLDNCEIKIRE